MFAALLLIAATPAAAADLRPLCANRPGKVTPPCIVDAGHLQVETGLVDTALSAGSDPVTDSNSFSATSLRVGLGKATEVELGWTPYAVTHEHRGVTRRGVGDVSLALRQSLRSPDGSGVSVALQPFVTFPVATNQQGAGGMTGGLLLPVSAALPAKFQLETTPEVDVLPDSDGPGHHARYTMVVALTRPFGAVTASIEGWASRNADPAGPMTQASLDANLAWQPAHYPNLQLDAGANAGITRDTAAIELYVGVVRRF